ELLRIEGPPPSEERREEEVAVHQLIEHRIARRAQPRLDPGPLAADDCCIAPVAQLGGENVPGVRGAELIEADRENEIRLPRFVGPELRDAHCLEGMPPAGGLRAVGVSKSPGESGL